MFSIKFKGEFDIDNKKEFVHELGVSYVKEVAYEAKNHQSRFKEK